MDHDNRCDGCTFYTVWPQRTEAPQEPDDRGLCKRYAPMPALVEAPLGTTEYYETVRSAFWPSVMASDGCGEFQPKSK